MKKLSRDKTVHALLYLRNDLTNALLYSRNDLTSKIYHPNIFERSEHFVYEGL